MFSLLFSGLHKDPIPGLYLCYSNASNLNFKYLIPYGIELFFLPIIAGSRRDFRIPVGGRFKSVGYVISLKIIIIIRIIIIIHNIYTGWRLQLIYTRYKNNCYQCLTCQK